MSFTTDVSFLHIYTGRRKLVLPGLNVLYYGRLISTDNSCGSSCSRVYVSMSFTTDVSFLHTNDYNFGPDRYASQCPL